MTVLRNRITDIMLKIFACDSPLRKRISDPEAIIQGAGVTAGQTVLEVGCGRGFFTIPLAERLGRKGCLYALDVAQVAVDYVDRKVEAAGLLNVRVFKANALDSGIPDGAMDLVLLFGVIPSPTLPLGQLLPEMHRVLRSGGGLAVWTAVPWWSPQSIVQSGLFVYIDKRYKSHNFQKVQYVR
jgi:demethylmenaquinone methyltransferase/2-methoxy-6-polyprenyl-1,4-benzoquinol methylase